MDLSKKDFESLQIENNETWLRLPCAGKDIWIWKEGSLQY